MIQYIFTLGAWVKNGNLPPICTRDYSGIESALVEGDIIGKYIYIYIHSQEYDMWLGHGGSENSISYIQQNNN